MKKIKILIYKLWNKVYCWCHKKPKVVGTDDTLDKLIILNYICLFDYLFISS